MDVAPRRDYTSEHPEKYENWAEVGYDLLNKPTATTPDSPPLLDTHGQQLGDRYEVQPCLLSENPDSMLHHMLMVLSRHGRVERQPVKNPLFKDTEHAVPLMSMSDGNNTSQKCNPYDDECRAPYCEAL
eukprot:5326925-Pyramimonas_sp.AAC.1